MKYLIFVSIAMSITLVSASQKIVIDKVDEFQGYRQIQTSSERIAKPLYLETTASALALKVENEVDTSISLAFFFRPASVTSLTKGSAVFLKLGDGSIEKLEYDGGYKIMGGGDISGIYVKVYDDLIRKIEKEKVVKIRISTSNETLDYDIDEKYRQIIPASLRLVADKIVQ